MADPRRPSEIYHKRTNIDGATLTPSKLAELRARVYAVLAAVYIRPPDRDFVKSLLANLSSLDIQKMGEMLPKGIVEGMKDVESYLPSRSEPVEQEHLLLSTEFTRLFRGIKRYESPPPPYESVYREGEVFGDLTSRVRDCYLRFGLDLASRFEGEPPDHIAFELDFLHNLCVKEAEAYNTGSFQEASEILKAERDFLEEHLLKWVGSFCEKVREHDLSGFYSRVAEVTKAWLELDHRQIDDRVGVNL